VLRLGYALRAEVRQERQVGSGLDWVWQESQGNPWRDTVRWCMAGKLRPGEAGLVTVGPGRIGPAWIGRAWRGRDRKPWQEMQGSSSQSKAGM
jgi:hypothetical protein